MKLPVAVFAVASLALPALAHDGAVHADQGDTAAHESSAALPPLAAPTALPFAVGGPYELVDQTGAARGAADPDGHYQLLFFGYANCQSICSVAMPMMADTVDRLALDKIAVSPVMITVDPARDTVASMGPPLAEIHPDFIGLTGDQAALDAAYGLFHVESKVVFEDPEFGPVFAHGSHIYLLNPAGEVLTLFPPILSAERAAAIVANYVTAGS